MNDLQPSESAHFMRRLRPGVFRTEKIARNVLSLNDLTRLSPTPRVQQRIRRVLSEIAADVAYCEHVFNHCVMRSIWRPEVLGSQNARDLVQKAAQTLASSQEALGPVTEPALVRGLVDACRERRSNKRETRELLRDQLLRARVVSRGGA